MINFWKNSSKTDKYFGAATLLVLIIGAVVFYGFTNVPFWDMTDPDEVSSYANSAEDGVPKSQSWIGKAYYLGDRGLKEDHDKAFKWLSKAADQGHTTSIRFLVNNLYDRPEVAKYVKVLENSEYTQRPAIYHFIGLFYENVFTANYDADKAFAYFFKAAMLGNIESMYKIAQYYTMDTVDASNVKAAAWLLLIYQNADPNTKTFQTVQKDLFGQEGVLRTYDQTTVNKINTLADRIAAQMFDFN